MELMRPLFAYPSFLPALCWNVAYRRICCDLSSQAQRQIWYIIFQKASRNPAHDGIVDDALQYQYDD
jgi:hypothetical protein